MKTIPNSARRVPGLARRTLLAHGGWTGRMPVPLFLAMASSVSLAAADFRGTQFFGWQDFAGFGAGATSGERTLTSPVFNAAIAWNELVVSWNAELPPDAGLKIEARALYDDHATKFYTLGLWSRDPLRHPRESVQAQKDADGDVQTDTLVLARPARHCQLRVTLAGAAAKVPRPLKFLGLSVLDRHTEPAELPPNRAAWGRTLNVPARSQLAYAEGKAWCSPTSTSMVLAYWAGRLKRPDLDHAVPEVARAVHDPNWPGTGNWPFNTAFAGAQRGLRAYVTRLSDVSELEDWIAAGLPVVVSVDYTLLKGERGPASGHLVVCVGFTEQGDPVVNDPGTRHEVRRVFPRANLGAAWRHSQRTVYLIYPETARVPRDRFGHWHEEKPRAASGRTRSDQQIGK